MKLKLDDTTVNEAIAKAILANNTDDACLIIQDAIGQDDGGVAGVFFSEFDSDEALEEQWQAMTAEERTHLLNRYVDCERSYDGLADDNETEED